MQQLTDQDFYASLKAGVAVVDFMADWCQPCKPVTRVLEELAGKLTAVQFYQVNVDQCPRIVGDFDVCALPTVIFFVNRQPVTALSGSQPTRAAIKRALAQLGVNHSCLI